ncbi:tyrosine-protein kinase-like otk [Photinus pyralis]|uniref:tyrosine-protein kinase-like otk n=1 Tax=Photinus pyralis TaxID=7054 RepID=UPI0012677795|nr:tyrosine-protein kinase-like otk [Photinus pyralis]
MILVMIFIVEVIPILVLGKPSIIEGPNSMAVEENKKSVLTCLHDVDNASEQYTVVKWKKDGKVLKHDYDEETTSHQRIRAFKQNGTLVIYSTKPSDRGDYVCEITTAGFEPLVSKSATISVIEILKFSPPPVNKKLELGSTAKIHCKAQGTPPPTIRWEKDGKGDGFDAHIADTNGTLHFNGVLSEDKGRYTCFASNTQGTINVTLTIDVVVAPKFTLLSHNPTEAIEGFSVMLDCVADGDPKPTIHWDKNLQMNDFNRSRFQVLDNGTLYIKEVHREDENNYGCTAGSSAGLNRKEIRLIVHTREGYHPEGNEAEDSTVTKAVLITMSVATAYIILVIGLMIWCRYRRRSRKLPIADGAKIENGDVDHTELKEAPNGVAPGSSQPDKDGLKNAHKEGQKSDGTETAHSQSSAQSKKSKSSYDKILLSRSHLKDLKLIGRGEFGDILIAFLPKSAVPVSDKRGSNASLSGEDKDLTVMVKSLTHTKDEAALTEFKREIDLLSKVSHENVAKLWGLCREVEPHYMILEYTDWGDLKQFLTATRKGTSQSLTPVQSVAVIHHLARGMEHLSAARFVHRDLAARNCLITSTLTAKVALPRLTKEPYSQEYCKHINNIIPLRWLPYEAVYEDEYSTKSDVYAFAVVILEVFSQGELPFPKINDTTFLAKLKEKALDWKSHKNTPDDLQKLQETCWNINPQERPSFEDLVKETEKILKSM